LTGISSIIMTADRRSKQETEIKLPLTDVSSGRRALLEAGFRLVKRRLFEQNVVFDTPGKHLKKRASLLRIRRAGKASLLTFKGPPLPGPHKSREELEISFAGSEALSSILERLGYQPVWRYEKFRSEYRKGPGIATLDETPIGAFLELEGPPKWIDRSARQLGFTAADYIQASYAKLYLQWCEDHHRAPGDMVFPKSANRKR
jgi:adenylate cyclase class 2